MSMLINTIFWMIIFVIAIFSILLFVKITFDVIFGPESESGLIVLNQKVNTVKDYYVVIK